MITIKRVILNTEDTVALAEVTDKKVYFFFENNEWFYATGDMYRFRNLEQTNGWSSNGKSFRVVVKNCMIATNPPRKMFEAADMYEFIDYIRAIDQPLSL